MERRWGFRPRTAFRHSRGWSQDELAARVSSLIWQSQEHHGGHADDRIVAVPGSRIGEYERWPSGGRRPTPYLLMMIAEAFDVSVESLLDHHDLQRLPPADKAILAALGRADHTTRPSSVAAATRR